MTVKGSHFGHETIWVYADTKEPVGETRRRCPKCGEFPTKEGFDPCLGFLVDDRIVSACCGHSYGVPYVIFSDGTRIDGWGNILPYLSPELRKAYEEFWKGAAP